MESNVRSLSLVATLAARPFQFLVYFLSGLVPRRSDLWVFGSWGGHRFADNAAAFFAFSHERLGKSVRLVWISHDRAIVKSLRARGYEAHGWWSPRGMACCLRAGLHLFDCFSKDTNFWLSRGARKINLWSGVPLKTFERDIDNERNRYYRLFHGWAWERFLYGVMMPWHLDRPDLIIATSQETKVITYKAFAVPEDSVVVTGFPRNDSLFVNEVMNGAEPRCPRSVLDAAAAGKPVFVYLPTFRDSAKPFMAIDWDRLDALMEELDAVFFIKLHPVDTTRHESHHSRIVQLYQDTDVYDVLPYASALVSDYSSVIFDYMLLDRPIVYFTPDLEEFVSSSRSLNFHPVEIAVGPVCGTSDELLTALAGVVQGEGRPQVDVAHREGVMRRIHDHAGAGANERVFAEIMRRFPTGHANNGTARAS